MKNIRVLSTDNIGFNGDYYVQMVNGKMLSNVPHKHDFYELFCVLSSSCVQNINGRSRHCDAQSVFVFSPADTHFCEEQNKGLSVLLLSVKKEEMQLFLRAYNMEDIGAREKYRLSQSDISRLKMLYTQSVMFPNDQKILKNILAVIMTSVLTNSMNQIFSVPRLAVQIADKMNEEHNLKEGLPALIRISGYSYSQLWRLMNQWFHMTPKEYINQLRMEYAYTLILTGNQRVEDIASSVGFSSFSHFNELIKKHYGYTSTELRKNLKNHIELSKER